MLICVVNGRNGRTLLDMVLHRVARQLSLCVRVSNPIIVVCMSETNSRDLGKFSKYTAL
jgi:hypothetical protein